jgi:hypothetical protein
VKGSGYSIIWYNIPEFPWRFMTNLSQESQSLGWYLNPGPPKYVDMMWCGALRHCYTCQKVRGSIPNGVIGIFHWHPSSRSLALKSTQLVTEINTRNISWRWRWPVHRAANHTTIICQLSQNLGVSPPMNSLGLQPVCIGIVLPLPLRPKYEIGALYTWPWHVT